MSTHKLLILLLGGLLSGCAVHGVVLHKSFTPLPFQYSLGIEGIYRFELRDGTRTFSQMVPARVYFSYAVGDEFDDRLSLEEGQEHNWKHHRGDAKEANAAVDRTSLSDNRAARLLLRQDMMPEREGF